MTLSIPKDEYLSSVGTEYGPGEWFTVDQDRIDLFAKATDDFQFIHVDPERAKDTPFGTTIAHGFLSLSLLAALVPKIQPKPENIKMGINYGIDKLRFLQPVKVDSEVRARTKILSIDEKRPGQFLTKTEVTIEIKGEEKPALIVEWLGMTILND
ncbi:MaoC family dehydratase [Sneathiella sp.]|uniref:MaoC family dehydratase n=1 Tax=Sneathiella sp. TaxID=1964365 RepID=UPI0035637A16